MKKNDYKLIVIVLVIALAAFIAHNFMGGKNAGTVTVKIDGEVTGK